VLRGIDSITRRSLTARSQPAQQRGHSGHSEPNAGERLDPVDDLCIAIRMRSMAPIGDSVSRNRSSRRNLDGNARAYFLPMKFRISCRVAVLRPGRGCFSLTTEPAEMLSFYPGADIVLRFYRFTGFEIFFHRLSYPPIYRGFLFHRVSY